MFINIDNMQVEIWDSGYPIWIHIRNGGQTVSLTHDKLQILIDALEASKRLAYGKLPDNCRHEIKL